MWEFSSVVNWFRPKSWHYRAKYVKSVYFEIKMHGKFPFRVETQCWFECCCWLIQLVLTYAVSTVSQYSTNSPPSSWHRQLPLQQTKRHEHHEQIEHSDNYWVVRMRIRLWCEYGPNDSFIWTCDQFIKEWKENVLILLFFPLLTNKLVTPPVCQLST